MQFLFHQVLGALSYRVVFFFKKKTTYIYIYKKTVIGCRIGDGVYRKLLYIYVVVKQLKPSSLDFLLVS
jgi:hypothetical protein